MTPINPDSLIHGTGEVDKTAEMIQEATERMIAECEASAELNAGTAVAIAGGNPDAPRFNSIADIDRAFLTAAWRRRIPLPFTQMNTDGVDRWRAEHVYAPGYLRDH